jgi:DNA-binding CsgD family transcriptional regulator
MEPFDLAQSFIERAARAHPMQSLSGSFQSALEHLGFRYFACCSHVDPHNPPSDAVMLHNYPVAWVSSYSERRLHQIDPVTLYAERTSLPFSWEAPDFRARLSSSQKTILAEARSVGLSRGYTIPMPRSRSATARASCSVVPDSRLIAADNYFAVQLMSTYLYELVLHRQQSRSRSRALGTLSVRERECLELVAQGKSDWAIGRILRISEHTVHRHVESAKQRLGVATRAQAVIRAAETGQISIGDVVRAAPPTCQHDTT